MSASNPGHPEPARGGGGPLVEGPHDPEHDPRASYVLEPEYVASLTERVLATTGTTVPLTSPLTGAPLANIPQSSTDDVAEAYRRARVAQAAWARTSMEERAAVMLRLHDLLLERMPELLDIITLENGKARKHAYDEVAHTALTARYYARMAGKHLATERRGGVLPVFTRIDINHVPKGVVGIISPWNYPLTMALSDGLPALMAGNAVVAKPDAQTMLTALMGVKLMDEAGFPRDLWQVVAGPGRELGTPMIERSDYICFTGSTATGKLIAKQCAERLIGCSLELGGKNPLLVLRDADIEKAAEGAVRASFSNAGQLCVSAERIFVADQVYDRFVERFVARTKALTLGATLDWEVDMGPLISRRPARDRDRPRRRRRREGRAGAHRRHGRGPTWRRTSTSRPSSRASRPRWPASVTRRSARSSRSTASTTSPTRSRAPTTASTASTPRSTARTATARGPSPARSSAARSTSTRASAPTFGSLAAPMGGMRESGMGRRQGAEGIHRYTETQSVGTQRVLKLAPQFGLSSEQYAKVQVIGLKVLNKLGRA